VIDLVMYTKSDFL